MIREMRALEWRGIAMGVLAAAAVIGQPGLTRADDPPPFPKTVEEAVLAEKDDALPLTAFYDQSFRLADSKPGALLASETVSDYALAAGVTATRILYHSVQDGADAMTSAVVLTPAGTPPEGGWPVIAWAHGTSGIARQCAPSAMKDVYYGGEGLAGMLAGGFAVVATDYHGLGTKGHHPYMNKADQANDVIYSVPAARKAVATLGKKWVVDGHSQGGLAAWGVAEAQAKSPDPDYLGAVAVAGATHLGWFLDHPEATKGAGFYLAWHAYAVQQNYPEFKVEDMLSSAAMDRYEKVTNEGCWLYGFLNYDGVEAPQMVKPGWRDNKWVRKFYLENSAGDKPVGGPMLVIAGEGDNSVPVEAIRDTVKKACGNKPVLEFKSYPGLDHDPVMSESTAAQLDWIRDRFAGKAASGNCSG
ncbi:lipase family protein [Rhizobium sp. S96]|uniref:lipase family protein n=1 Tax=Rhizobium sp. S96 TaxID=3055140 RepID=UPI0025AAB5A7|nr:lipase family protein [Rhizobium sp. S96]MDM9619806.1 lipase family protein [Rhizobium sp. S96]